MAQMMVVYKPPKDPTAFERHYFEVHVPLARRLPGKDAFASECGQACVADRRALVPDERDVQIFLFDTRSV